MATAFVKRQLHAGKEAKAKVGKKTLIVSRGATVLSECKNCSKFMQCLSEDIRREIPDAGCFSCGNIYYMRWFSPLYCIGPILPQLGGKLKEREREVRVNCSPSWGIIEVEAQLLFEKRDVIGMEDAP